MEKDEIMKEYILNFLLPRIMYFLFGVIIGVIAVINNNQECFEALINS